jgi:hypothetical protein
MPSEHRLHRLRVGTIALTAALAALGACQPNTGASASITLDELRSSGVHGTVRIVDLTGGRSRVEVEVEPAGNRDMPAHIHPGTCAELVPQPRFPLENVKDGRATTVVPASMVELFDGDLAVTLHESNDNLKVMTACADLVTR